MPESHPESGVLHEHGATKPQARMLQVRITIGRLHTSCAALRSTCKALYWPGEATVQLDCLDFPHSHTFTASMHADAVYTKSRPQPAPTVFMHAWRVASGGAFLLLQITGRAFWQWACINCVALAAAMTSSSGGRIVTLTPLWCNGLQSTDKCLHSSGAASQPAAGISACQQQVVC